MKKDFLTLSDLTREEAEHIFSLADRIKYKPSQFSRALRGRSFVLIFDKPSLRTRLSFELGIKQMGGEAVSFTANEILLGQREAIKDIARTVSVYVDGAIIRTFRQETAEEFAHYAKAFVVNALTDKFHPAQVLSDIYTIRSKKRGGKKLKIAFIGDGNNVCHSLVRAARLFKFKLFIACPPQYCPSSEIVSSASGYVEISHDPKVVARNADILYTDVWTSMGKEKEKMRRLRDFKKFTLNDEIMKKAKKDCLIMHCLPAHRGEEISDAVIESRNSIVFEQAENRLYVQKALLYYLAQRAK